MTIHEYITKFKNILSEFDQIIIVQDGEFDIWLKSYFTLKYIEDKYSQCNIRYNILKTGVIFIALENTGKIRGGGLTVKAYLYKVKNILPLLNGVVIYRDSYFNKKLEFDPNHLDALDYKGIGSKQILDVKVSRDLYLVISVNKIWKKVGKWQRYESHMEGGRLIRKRVLDQSPAF